MNKLTIDDIELAGKRVLTRVDFNVPLDGEKVADDTRINASIPTIHKIVTSGGKAILMSHLGRPKGEVNAQFSLEPVAARLAAMARKTGELALQSVRQRLANFLIKEADNVNSGEHIFWTRDDMARQIGTVRDVVTRHLRIFEEKGLIRRERGDILLLERRGLENIANGIDTT